MAQVTAEYRGTPPLYDPDERGSLEYPIILDGICTVALLDHGCARSFVEKEWCRRHALPTLPLSAPFRLREFSGTITWIDAQLLVQKVGFANVTHPFTFYVATDAPCPVVLGLDIIRAWNLCHNPLNDHVLSLPAADKSFREKRLATNTLEDPAHRYEQSTNDSDTFPSCITGDMGGYSVTANTDDDKQIAQQILDSLDPQLRLLIEEFPSVFSPPDRVPPERPVKHFIHLKPDVVPVRRPPYPLSQEKCLAMREQVSELAEVGWITPSSSPWGAPILFVRKKGGEWRLCIDFRDLNALTVDDSYPLPRLETLLHRSGHANVFSKIDLASGFHQIALETPSRPATAFRLPEPVYGCTHWEWTVMPFGLKNAPPTFQRAMTLALQGCEDFAIVYIDDILVFSVDSAAHLDHLRCVFERLQQHSFHTRLTKCELMKPVVEFLGHSLSCQGLSTTAPKVSALRAWEPPLKNHKEVRQFLGLAAWYRAFIPHLATIAAPLSRLTSGRLKFQWTTEATEAVRAIQELVSQAPCLARWEHNRETRVITDASKIGIGAVLEQLHPSGWRPVAFWSRKLRDPETRYSATDREWLAVVEAVSKRWRGLLEDTPFTLLSDHAALQTKLSKGQHEPPLNDRHARWVQALLPFPLTFKYLKGELNVVADALSRCPTAVNSVTIVRSLWSGLMEMVRLAAEQDPTYPRPATPSTPECPSSPATKAEVQLATTPSGQWIVPNNQGIRTFLISEAHDQITNGHFGEQKTWDRLSQHWSWKGAREDVKEYIRTCALCQKIKAATHKPPGLLHPIVSTEPGKILTLDFVSKFTPAAKTGNQQCLVFVNKFSRFTFLNGCPDDHLGTRNCRNLLATHNTNPWGAQEDYLRSWHAIYRLAVARSPGNARSKGGFSHFSPPIDQRPVGACRPNRYPPPSYLCGDHARELGRIVAAVRDLHQHLHKCYHGRNAFPDSVWTQFTTPVRIRHRRSSEACPRVCRGN